MVKERDDTGKTQAIGFEIVDNLPTHIADAIKVILAEPEYATIINIETTTELCMAAAGNMQKINAHGYDFIRVIDGVVYTPDSKTCSVSTTMRASGTYRGMIRNVTRSTGFEKAGDLLSIVYIPLFEDVKYFYIPKAWWVNNVNNAGQISFTWDPKTNSIPAFEDFECETFEDLCSPDRVGEWERRKAKQAKLWAALLKAETDEDKDVARAAYRAAYIKEVKVA